MTRTAAIACAALLLTACSTNKGGVDGVVNAIKDVAKDPATTSVVPKVAKNLGSDIDCSVTDGGPVAGPDCVTAEITCGQTIVGHTKGGVDRYDTKFYESNTCWPGTRNHNGGDERVYLFLPDKSPRFQAGEERQRVTVTFNSPCSDLTFTKMVGVLGTCPSGTAQLCDSANPFTRKGGISRTNITVDAGEVYYFLVEGADDNEGAFSLTLDCGT